MHTRVHGPHSFDGARTFPRAGKKKQNKTGSHKRTHATVCMHSVFWSLSHSVGLLRPSDLHRDLHSVTVGPALLALSYAVCEVGSGGDVGTIPHSSSNTTARPIDLSGYNPWSSFCGLIWSNIGKDEQAIRGSEGLLGLMWRNI